MTDFKGFVFKGKKLDATDYAHVGAQIGVGEDIVRAVFETETAGKSTDKKGRIRILYEPHVMYRSLGRNRQAIAVKAGLAYPEWGERPYPADSYPIFLKAMEFDETAALKACSWGLPQIMGANHRLAGYDTPQAMVEDFLEDEENQLRAMIRFIKASGADDELQAIERKIKLGQTVTADDCRPFVAIYNGKGYAKNGYHTKFAASLAKWRKIPDAIDGDAAITLANDGVSTMTIQQRLDDLGYHEVGTIDGKMGSRTKGAILAFQNDNGLPTDGKITKTLLAALMVAKPRPISEERATATAADLREAGDKEIKHVDRTKAAAYAATGLGLFQGGSELLDGVKAKSDIARSIWDNVEPFQQMIKDNAWLILAAIGGVVIWQAIKLQRTRVEKHRRGMDLSQ